MTGMVSMATGAMTGMLEVSPKRRPEKKKSLHRHRPPLENEAVQTFPLCPAVAVGVATVIRESFPGDALSSDPPNPIPRPASA
ncbi:hypothetical protein Lal_00049780 [Lupinus albus]|uniref:Uncharacterized protein n=1 Tax=Lupinus albus TaxID=3870 RepID=A0A6A5LYJ0_LUPAL|nr:hypothetical protein Lalb_Chr12g0201591 [Lupinus albus]KAF1867351.1 hypothetical protein Lal_00049780 [Lupinus albus]